jgi:transposase-like protein
MGTSRRIAPEIKEQILRRIKEQGVSVAEAAKEHGIHETTIYGWLSTTASSGPSLRELNALRKENAMLKTLVGEMTITLSRSQKKR